LLKSVELQKPKKKKGLTKAGKMKPIMSIRAVEAMDDFLVSFMCSEESNY